MNQTISQLIESELDKMELLLSMDLIYIIPLNQEIINNFSVFLENMILRLFKLNLVTFAKVRDRAARTEYSIFLDSDQIRPIKQFKLASDSYKTTRYFSFNPKEIYIYSQFKQMLIPEAYVLEAKPHVKPTLD